MFYFVVFFSSFNLFVCLKCKMNEKCNLCVAYQYIISKQMHHHSDFMCQMIDY